MVGVAIAPLIVRALIAFQLRNTAVTDLQANIDLRMLLFAFLLSMATGLLAGAVPAWQARRDTLVSPLQQRAGTAVGGLSVRRAIVTAQIAFTLILMVAAGLFMRTLHGLLSRGPGFDASSLIVFGIRPAQNGYSPSDANQLIRTIHDRIRNSASVQNAAIVNFPLLLGGAWNNPLTIQSTQRLVTDRDIHLNAVTPGFFATLGTKIVAGRDLGLRPPCRIAAL